MMMSQKVRAFCIVVVLTGACLWLSGSALSQDEPLAPGQTEDALEAAELEETEPVVESILDVDIDIGRVQTESDEGDDRNAARYISRQLQREGGELIEDCLMSMEQTPSSVVTMTVEGSGMGTGIGNIVSARELRGDLLLEGGCANGICSLRPRRSGSLDRPLANCIAESFASFLTGRPDADRQYGIRIPLRFLATETQRLIE